MSRPSDYLYDPLLTISKTDFLATHRATVSQDKIKKVAVYKNLFSESERYPKTENVLKEVSKEMSDNIVNNYNRNTSNNASLNNNILGTDRTLFFKRPLIPYMTSVLPESLYNKETREIINNKTNTVAMQTDYRENDTQTDPYTPDYIIKSNNNPEVLYLQSLKYKNGLPPTLQEVQWIERARKKREFEKNLPLITGNDFEKRKKLLEQQELEDFRYQESEIDKLHERRISLLKDALNERDNQMNTLNAVRLEQMKQKKQIEKDVIFDSIKKRRMKAMRVISQQRADILNSNKKKDIIDNYADYGSSVYASLARDGNVIHPPIKLVDDISTLSTLSGIESIRSEIPASMLTVTTKIPTMATTNENLRPNIVSPQANNPTKERSKSKEVVNAYKKLENLVRPSTPTVESTEDDETVGIILLQRLLRGRAQQNLMFEGMQHRLELIRELRMKHEHVENSLEIADAAIDFAQGLIVSETLDNLSKALIHLNEERELNNIMQVAESTRKKREIVESGRRQRESIPRMIAERNEFLEAKRIADAKLAEHKLAKQALLDEEAAAMKDQEAARIEIVLENKVEVILLPVDIITALVNDCLDEVVSKLSVKNSVELLLNEVIEKVEVQVEILSHRSHAQAVETDVDKTINVENVNESGDPTAESKFDSLNFKSGEFEKKIVEEELNDSADSIPNDQSSIETDVIPEAPAVNSFAETEAPENPSDLEIKPEITPESAKNNVDAIETELIPESAVVDETN